MFSGARDPSITGGSPLLVAQWEEKGWERWAEPTWSYYVQAMTSEAHYLAADVNINTEMGILSFKMERRPVARGQGRRQIHEVVIYLLVARSWSHTAGHVSRSYQNSASVWLMNYQTIEPPSERRHGVCTVPAPGDHLMFLLCICSIWQRPLFQTNTVHSNSVSHPAQIVPLTTRPLRKLLLHQYRDLEEKHLVIIYTIEITILRNNRKTRN